MTKLKPTTLMVIDQTLRGKYAMNAPDVPDWFKGNSDNLPNEPIIDSDEVAWRNYEGELMKWAVENLGTIYFQWRWYYADRMIEIEFKK